MTSLIKTVIQVGEVDRGYMAERVSSKLSYINSIDGIRAIAVLTVVAFHANSALMPSGFLGVDVFFIISAFVVTYSISHRLFKTRREFILYFYRRRALRLFPALIFWVIISSILTIFFVPRTEGSIDFFKTGISALFGVSNIYLSFSSSNYFAPTAELNPFTQTWSLGVEEQFYVLFSLLIVTAGLHRKVLSQSRPMKLTVMAISLVSIIAAAILSRVSPLHAFYMIDTRLWQLGLGMSLALTLDWWKPLLARVPQAIQSGLAIALLLTLMILFVAPPFARVPFPHALPTSIISALLIALMAVSEQGIVGRLLTSAVPAKIGQASYSIYLAHWPIMVLARWTIGLNEMGQQLICIGLSIALGFASYRLVEQPVRNAPRLRLEKPGRVVIGSIVLLFLAGGIVGGSFLASNILTLSQTGNRNVWSGFKDGDIVARACGLRTRPLDGFAGMNESVQIDVTTCAGKSPSKRQMLVAGDSHAGAYRRMLTEFAEATRIPVALYSRGGCALFNLKLPNDGKGPACADFSRKVLADIRNRVRPGDYVFLPSMRVPRIIDMWGHPNTTPESRDPVAEHHAMIEAEQFILEVTGRGATVILEAPLPVARTPAFRCLDWFNRNNPVCAAGFSTTRAEQDANRAEAMVKLARLAQLPRVTIWDPLPLLCRKDRCDLVVAGVPMFYDGDHVTGSADDRLAPDFVAFIGRLDMRLAQP